ncbi:transposase domain-containing protein [Shewanella sp. OMA3-2]
MRKRRLPLEAVMWSVIGMSFYRQQSVWDSANQAIDTSKYKTTYCI